MSVWDCSVVTESYGNLRIFRQIALIEPRKYSEFCILCITVKRYGVSRFAVACAENIRFGVVSRSFKNRSAHNCGIHNRIAFRVH